jgi:hypothetical protein
MPFLWFGGSGSKKKKSVASELLPPTLSSSAAPSEEVAASPSNRTTASDFPDKDRARALRSYLQKELGREVSVWGEGPFRKVVRVATNPYLVLGAATVGVGVAGVLTAGTAHVVLGAVGAGQLSSTGSKAIDWWKSRRQGTVRLDPGAVNRLLSMDPEDRRVKAVQAVLAASPPGDAYITEQQLDAYIAEQQLMEASAKQHSDRRLSRAVRALRSPYGRAGLALLGAGLFLIAVTLIPEYIHDPSLRVAVVVSAIGGILTATAMVEAFKDALMGSSDP